MDKQKLGSINISGSGTASGGVYEEVKISGSGKATGDIEAKRIGVSGSACFNGCVKAETFKCSGSFQIDGKLDAGECSCSGSGRMEGDVNAASLRVSGSVTADGNVMAKEANISGSAKVAGDLQGDDVRASGLLNIGGLLSADKIEISLYGHSHIREIGGESITVRAHGGGLHSLFHGKCGSLEVESVEGDDIYLESTTAKVVRGQRVKIGPGCRIGRVEYGESLETDECAQVDDTSFTGEGPAPAVAIVKSQPLGHTQGWQVHLGNRDIHNPVLKALVVILAFPIAFVAVALAVLVAGGVVSLALGGVGLLMAVLAIGIPIILVVAIVLKALSIPIQGVGRHFRR